MSVSSRAEDVGPGFDYWRVEDMAALRRFLEEKMGGVKGLQRTHTYFMMEEVKATHRVAMGDPSEITPLSVRFIPLYWLY